MKLADFLRNERDGNLYTAERILEAAGNAIRSDNLIMAVRYLDAADRAGRLLAMLEDRDARPPGEG